MKGDWRIFLFFLKFASQQDMEFGVYAVYVRTAHPILHEETIGNTEFYLSCSYQSEKRSNYLFISKQIKLVLFGGGGGEEPNHTAGRKPGPL